MARVELFQEDGSGWMTCEQAAEVGWATPSDAKRTTGGARRIRHRGSEDDPQLIDVRVGPDQVIESHADIADEIIYVVSGELHLGARVLKPGDSVSIPGKTLYSFKAGPAGLEFLNFRPYNDETYFTKERFVQLRAEEKLTNVEVG